MSNRERHAAANGFASRIEIELKRAERYRIFVSLVVFNLGQVLESVTNGEPAGSEARKRFLEALGGVVKSSVREIDAVSNSGKSKIGLLFPETPRQGAEAAARRISDTLNSFCNDYFRRSADYLIPVEISSYPDASGARSVISFMDEFSDEN